MRSTIRTACAACGDVDVPVDRARLDIGVDGRDPRNRLRFRCPRCGRDGSQLLDERGSRLLLAAGIEVAAPAPAPRPAATGADTEHR